MFKKIIPVKNLIKKSLVFFLITVGTVMAQESSDTTDYETDEIIISATRTEQKLIDIPFSVQRVDQSKYRSQRREDTS